jgi:hypothetical protein
MVLYICLSLFVRARALNSGWLQAFHFPAFLATKPFLVNYLPFSCIQSKADNLLTFSTHSTHQNYS